MLPVALHLQLVCAMDAHLKSGLHYLIAMSAASSVLAGCLTVYRNCRQIDLMAAQFQLDTGPQATLLYDRNGQLVFSLHDEERTDQRLDQVSPSLVSAVLAAEDRHFRSHSGVDVVRMAGAAINDVKEWRLTQGASTITQQLVRSQTLGRERTWTRKWREILLALRIERRFTKNEILETYLNRIYLGDGYFGVQAASQGYFGKNASSLDVPEAALLAGIIRCPSACSPRNEPDRARRRRDVVLQVMLEDGDIKPDAYRMAIATDLGIKPRRGDGIFPVHEDGRDPSALYFIDAVRRELAMRFGQGAVLRSGLRVYTTLDPGLQRAAEDAITGRLAELQAQERGQRKSRSQEDPIEGSLVAIDPRSGEVLALVGGRDYHETPFNRAIEALRQPGSAFKPIVYATALEHGMVPSTILDHLDDPIAAVGGAWLPADEHEGATFTLRQALIVSSNRAAAQLLQRVGMGATQYYAKRLGITTPMPAIPSLALGTAEVSLMDLTTAYGVFADKGALVPTHLISRVEDGAGDVIWQSSTRAVQVLRPATAFMMSSMLADVINRGTGTQARAQGFTLPAAGKTGTTQDSVDTWFIGYTPNLVAGVWFGRDQPEPIQYRATAARIAVPAWARFMKQATAGHRPDWYPVPSDLEKVTICPVSGMRATNACRAAGAVIDEYFPKGTAPKPCSVHSLQLTPPIQTGPPEPQPVSTSGAAPLQP
jgi:1A family penicillin-binding protein